MAAKNRVPRSRPTAGLQADVEPINTGKESQRSRSPARQHASEWTQLGTYVPPDVARALRIHAAADRTSIRDIVTAALRAHPPLAPYLASNPDSQNAS